jgi:hypothetical protein
MVAVAATGLVVFPDPAQARATLTGAAPSTPVHMLDVLGRVVMATTTDARGTAPVTYLPYPVACTSCALASKQCASP